MIQILYFRICTHTHHITNYYDFHQMELQLPIKQILPVTKIGYFFMDCLVCRSYFHNIHSKAKKISKEPFTNKISVPMTVYCGPMQYTGNLSLHRQEITISSDFFIRRMADIIQCL